MQSNKKIIAIILLFTILIYIFINLISNNNSLALTQTREKMTDKLNKYPGYTQLINDLKKKHPNWNFTIFYTGLDWNQVIKNETTSCHGRNLVSSSKSGSWFCGVCGNKPYDNGSWRCASEAAVSYYMDPRNSLNDTYIFQFEALSFNEKIQTIEGVKQILSDVKYMQGDTITYTKTDGTKGTINKSYAQVIMEAAKEANVSPYHLAARIRQEQGTGSKPSVIANGEYEGYIGYYNFFNINATGSSNSEIIRKALKYAKDNQLTDPEKSIKAGAKFLAKDYIGAGQDTLYLQKFDVDNSDGALYYFQYMQNLSASKSEGYEVKKSYEKIGMVENAIDFIIPVYENMPAEPCEEPIPDNVVTQNVKVKGDEVRVREGKSTSSKEITRLNTGDILLRIETATSKNEGYYWDKIVLPNGTIGYMARSYLVEIPDVTNCNDKMIVKESVNLRNGPGLNQTTIITTLTKGQVITRIEKGKYNLNNYIWDRVILEDGRQGYLATDYITEPNSTNNGETTINEIVKVVCQSGLKVREQPGTDKKVQVILNKNEILTRTKKEVSLANGYIWDEVITNSGIKGYVARGDKDGDYIKVVENNNNTQNPPQEKPTTPSEEKPNTTIIKENKDLKISEQSIICTPNTTIETLKNNCTSKNIKIKDSKGTEIKEGNIGTGYVIQIDDKSYTVIKLGDVNGDATINSGDLFFTQKYLLKKTEFNQYEIKACDVNKDNVINSGDLFFLQKYLLKKTDFSL